MSKFFDFNCDELLEFESKLSSLSNPSDDLYDYPYWYGMIKQRAETDFELNNDPKLKIAKLIWGHCDEYSKRLIDESIEDKIIFSQPRITCYGKINDSLASLWVKVFMKYPKEIELWTRLENESYHAKASLYGAIKFALTNGISKSDIIEWHPNFEDSKELIMGIDPFQSIREKINPNEDSNERTYQLYELDEKEKENLPFWFREGNYIHFYKEGKTVVDNKTKKSIVLNSLERSMYSCLTEISVLLEKFPEDYMNSLFYLDIYEKSELIKHWFEKNNKEAYLLLIKDEGEEEEINPEEVKDESTENKSNEVNFCPECGGKFNSNNKFCSGCGNKII